VSDGDAVLEALRGRRSVRRFRADLVPREVIERALEAATWAPSPGNRQGWEFAVVTAEGAKRRLSDLARGGWERALAACPTEAVGDAIRGYAENFLWFAEAPAVVAVAARSPEAFLSRMFGEDAADVAGTKAAAAMAAANLMLAAHALGLAACCLTGPLAGGRELAEALGFRPRMALVCLVALGYPAESPPPPPRKPLADVARDVA
jgi:nitroreductase